ncbi:MAG: Dolichyl-phosphate-mannose-protein mannosyltransferase, partial [Candidatus Sumerlaeota bacterium]|nr:Dolichyl-phosphate-mannose-protein mannosyltransferase [Candidatus Sumerlaeota bacterium]
PLFIYAMAPCFAFTPDPRFAVLALAMAGTLAIGLTGMTARRLWGGWAAVVAAAIVCFSPTAIDHSRRLWGHDTIIFFSALTTYCTVRGIQMQRKKFLWVAMASAAAAQACHLTGVLLWILPVGALLIFRPRQWKLSLAVGAGLLLLVYAPWIAHEIAPGEDGRRFDETRLVIGLVTGEAEVARRAQSPDPAFKTWLLQLADGGHNDLLGLEYGAFLRAHPVLRGLYWVVHVVMAALVLCALAALLGTAWRHRKRPTTRRWALLGACAALAPPVLFTILPVTTVPPYQLPAFIPTALGVAWVLTRFPSILRGATWREQRSEPLRRRALAASAVAVLLCSVFGVWYTMAQRRFVVEATPLQRTTTILDHKLDAIALIVSTAGGATYAISQDGRDPRAGVDFWVLYLHYYVSGEEHAPTDPLAEHLYVIRDSKSVLRPEVAPFLDRFDATEIGTLRVTRLMKAEAREWRRLTAEYPSAPPE